MNECRHRWNRYWTFGSLAVIFASAAAAMAMGRFTISPRELAAVLVPGAFPGEEVPGQVRTVISNIRLPRVLLALLSGAGLAAAGVPGAVCQSPGHAGHPGGCQRRILWRGAWNPPGAACIRNPAVGHGIGNRGSADGLERGTGQRRHASPYGHTGRNGGQFPVLSPCLPGEIRCRPPGCASRHFLLAHGQHGKHHKGHPGHGGAVHPDRQRAAVPVKVEA